jgi:uncharacterized integral membrane protein
MRQVVIAVIVLAALAAILQNREQGQFSFLFFDFEAPRWVLTVTVFGAGLATGYLIAHRRSRRRASGA